jgi:ribosome-binding factor A
MKLTSNTILITGGGSGIGYELTKQLAALGNTILITGRDQAKIDRAKAAFPQIRTFRSDVSDPKAIATRDPVFDGTLRQGLSVQLEQSPFLSIVTDDRIQQALRMMGQKPNAKLTSEIARDLCQRVGSAAVVEGSVAQVGTPYLLTVRAVNCSNGETLASTEALASDKNHVLAALGEASSAIRRKLGESLSLEARSLHGADASAARTDTRAAYQGFLKLWKDADPDIPVLKQAKAEYAKPR